jgi:hypothetical protein
MPGSPIIHTTGIYDHKPKDLAFYQLILKTPDDPQEE